MQTQDTAPKQFARQSTVQYMHQVYPSPWTSSQPPCSQPPCEICISVMVKSYLVFLPFFDALGFAAFLAAGFFAGGFFLLTAFVTTGLAAVFVGVLFLADFLGAMTSTG
eukprot:GHVQ01015357.1.p1 GENE.GHVQ01015357.1~~GHVQ01015357.1.p1  ORF type:complete len:109 (+),score=7.63 GHVQ01015357.1:647-973(+)